jgi:AcrR family transcriptional regulator
MSAETEQKILDAALHVFSKQGYVGARTRMIAKKSGYTEMTLFRKFETKENLFNQVLITNQERIMEDFNSLLVLDDTVEPKRNFSNLIWNLMELVDKNFEYVKILISERDRISNSVAKPFILRLGKCLDRIFPKLKLDSIVLSFTIFSFIYFIIFNKKRENEFFDLDVAVEEFIEYHSNCLQYP